MENGGQNSNSNGNYSWGYREVGRSSFDWVLGNNTTTTTNNNNNHGLMFDTHHHHYHQQQQQQQQQQHQQQQQQQQQMSLYYGGGGGGGEGGSHVHPDPHLTCLKLGKRHYFEDSTGNGSTGTTTTTGVGIGDVLGLGERHVSGGFKRGKSYEVGPPSSSSTMSSLMGVGVSMGSTSVVPKCQVEGCHVVLLNAKDYHRRHKVCEMHSKAPKVVVLGTEQRFCQQCSRFHVISEFDDTKRSCRRRLAGHNERRRKSSNDSISRNLSQDHHRSMTGRLPCTSSSTGRALSLLSSNRTISWDSPSDLSSRSSAALRELIAENRAAILARQLLLEQGWHHHHAMDDLTSTGGINQPGHVTQQQHQVFPEQSEWARFHEAGGHVTLDLMHEPSSPFGYLSERTKSKEEEEEEECSEIWKSLEGTHVV